MRFIFGDKKMAASSEAAFLLKYQIITPHSPS